MRLITTARTVAVLCTAFGVLAVPAVASIGVGVGSGKVTVQEPLKPGGIYELPAMPVLNTGDEPSEYGVSIEFNETQPQRKPAREWFSFQPATFHLEPNESRVVSIKLTLPISAPPGEYFAYIEAHPVHTAKAGQTGVGVAAAAKLSFSVIPANVAQGLYYWAAASIAEYAPWSHVALIVLAGAILISLIRRFVDFNIGIRIK